MTDFAVVVANESHLPFVMTLMRKNRESVGGLPAPAVLERIRRQTLFLGVLNGEPCSYLMFDVGKGVLRIPQACVQYDARRRRYAEGLFLSVLSAYPFVAEVRLRCAADVEANLFWQAMGFVCVGQEAGGKRRGRTLNLWQMWLNDTHLFSVTDLAVVPVAERREDCRDAETGFLAEVPNGFSDGGSLGKLAWRNRP